MTITAIIVDDEPLAREVIREHLGRDESFEVVAQCANGFEAVREINEKKPDLVFLDIQMPKLDGFEVIDLLDHTPVIVFVTAFDEYALKAFEVHAVDYLLKPFSEDRFDDVLRHVRERVKRGNPGPLRRAVSDARHGPITRILVRQGGAIEVVPIARVDYIEASDDDIRIHSGDKVLTKQERMGELETRLDPSRFVRIHRSYLLNVDRLERVEFYAKDSRIAILRDGTKLPVSRSGYAKLRELL